MKKKEKQQIPSKMSSYYAKRNRCASSNGTVNGLSASLSRTSFFLAFFMRIFAFFLRFFFLFYFYFFIALALENAILATFTIGIALQDYATWERD